MAFVQYGTIVKSHNNKFRFFHRSIAANKIKNPKHIFTLELTYEDQNSVPKV